MIGFFVEFPNDDAGPFRTREEAEAYRQHEGNLDETQVFESSDLRWPWLDLATFCPDAMRFLEVAAMREP